VQRLAGTGAIDRGAAAEAISSANVELNVVRWTNADGAEQGLPDPGELHEELRRSWAVFAETLEIGSPTSARAAGFHLHNYAAFLASPGAGDVGAGIGPATEADAERAVQLFADVVIPARDAYFRRTGVFRPLRNSLQIASRATTRLAELAWGRSDRGSARRWAAQGLGWVRWALDGAGADHPLTAQQPTEGGVRFAMLAVPALTVALEVGVNGCGPDDLDLAERLLGAVRAWESPLGDGLHHARHREVADLAQRLAQLRR
jgi:hypothetical protein